MLNDDELLRLAGKAAFARGRDLARNGQVELALMDERGFEGEAHGSDDYALWFRRDGERRRWNCDCPAADGGAFCKHLVAAVLTGRAALAGEGNDEAPADAAPASARKTAKSQPQRKDGLLDFLRAQPAERLAGWLCQLADEDAAVARRLAVHRAADDPASLKAAIGTMLAAGGFLDHRASNAYARRLDAVRTQLEQQVARDPDAGRVLCEYAIGRLLKIYARSDDSGGAIGEQVRAVAALHARACEAAPPGRALAKPLFALQRKDDWGLFPLERYWSALAAPGQAVYARLVLDEFATLPQVPAAEERWGSAFGIQSRTEALARANGDFELLQRVLRRDLSRPRDCLRVLESLRDASREREALDWAEQAVKRFPDDDGLRVALAECLRSAGLDGDAIEQAWQAFDRHPAGTNWDALKRMAAAEWPHWRERALAHVAARERGNVDLRVQLLDHDGDFDAAVALARSSAVYPGTLDGLARRLERDAPLLAGEFHERIAAHEMANLSYSRYPALVSVLRRAVRCLPAERGRALVARVRAEHQRKARLIALLDQAGL